MGGGLMQLVAYGAQDIYLTGNPQITFFKVVYRRHTNFSMESIQQTFNGSVGTGSSTVTATISRNGDLVSRLWLEVDIDRNDLTSAGGIYANWTNNTGHAFVKDCEIEIGGQKIDKHYGHWLDVWNELTDKDGQEYSMLNKHSAKNAYLKSGSNTTSMNAVRCYVPLKFWFCCNPGLALPLIALQYHEVKVKFNFRAVNELINADGSNTAFTAAAPTVSLWSDYVYLDTDERRRFAQVSHEYLIEQLQYTKSAMAKTVDLTLNHPVKHLVWVGQENTVGTASSTITSSVDATANVQGAAMSNNEIGTNIDSDESTMYATYATGGFTVGVQSSDLDHTTANSDQDSIAYGITYAVNDDLSIGYSYHELSFESSSLLDQESTGISASYTMGGMTLAGATNEVNNMQGQSAAANDVEGYEFTLSFAF